MAWGCGGRAVEGAGSRERGRLQLIHASAATDASMTDRRRLKGSRRRRTRDRTLATDTTDQCTTTENTMVQNVWEMATEKQANSDGKEGSTLTTTTTTKEDKDADTIKNKDRAVRVARSVNQFIIRTLGKGVRGLQDEFLNTPKNVPPNAIAAFKENCVHAKNRFNDLCCLDSTRVHLRNHATNYIHASWVATVRSSKRFILTQAPMETTIADFWRMIEQEEVEHIVQLCDFFEDNRAKCAKYVPTSKGERLQFDNYELMSVQISEMIVERPDVEEPKVITTDLKVTTRNGFKRVQHHRWAGWADRKVPRSTATILSLLHSIRATKRPIVVHCSAGVGRASTLAGIEVVLETIFQGNECQMDTFLGRLRQQRAHAVSTDLQYLFLHKAIIDYMRAKKKVGHEHTERVRLFLKEYDKFMAESESLK